MAELDLPGGLQDCHECALADISVNVLGQLPDNVVVDEGVHIYVCGISLDRILEIGAVECSLEIIEKRNDRLVLLIRRRIRLLELDRDGTSARAETKRLVERGLDFEIHIPCRNVDIHLVPAHILLLEKIVNSLIIIIYPDLHYAELGSPLHFHDRGRGHSHHIAQQALVRIVGQEDPAFVRRHSQDLILCRELYLERLLRHIPGRIDPSLDADSTLQSPGLGKMPVRVFNHYRPVYRIALVDAVRIVVNLHARHGEALCPDRFLKQEDNGLPVACGYVERVPVEIGEYRIAVRKRLAFGGRYACRAALSHPSAPVVEMDVRLTGQAAVIYDHISCTDPVIHVSERNHPVPAILRGLHEDLVLTVE